MVVLHPVALKTLGHSCSYNYCKIRGQHVPSAFLSKVCLKQHCFYQH